VEPNDLARRLRSRRWREAEDALAEAVVAGALGDHLLADLLRTGDRYQRQAAAGALGDLQGDEGMSALREAIQASGPGSRDLRSAALLALAKRCGEEATPDLVTALSARDGVVKDYAVIGLAGAADGRAWPEVFERLVLQLRRPSMTLDHTEVLVATAYLVQHLDGDSERLIRLVTALRSQWARMNQEETAWFDSFWPDARPTGPDAADVRTPDPKAVRAWARQPFFEAGPTHQ
jgi:hypothetical protein